MKPATENPRAATAAAILSRTAALACATLGIGFGLSLLPPARAQDDPFAAALANASKKKSPPPRA